MFRELDEHTTGELAHLCMHSWAALEMIYYALCQLWVAIQAAYSNAGAYDAPLPFTCRRWERRFIVRRTCCVWFERAQYCKYGLLLCYCRVKLDENVACQGICLYAPYSRYLT
jgi:hypothetical protein